MSALSVLTAIVGFSVLNLVGYNIYFTDQPTDLDSLTNYVHAFTICAIYLVVVALLSVLPLNGRKEDAFAGFLSVIVVFTTIFGLESSGFQAVEYITTHIYYLAMSSYILSFTLSILYSMRSPVAKGTHWLEAFYFGTEPRPYLFGLDLKMYVNRIAVQTLVILELIFLYKSLYSGWMHPEFKVNKTLIAVLIFELIYAADAMIFEYVFETGMEVQKEGFGCPHFIGYQAYPFMMIILSYHIQSENIEVEDWRLVVMIICFVIGYGLYRIGNDQIYAYRKDPSSVPVSGLIPTDLEGKKLFCGGLWGLVRHPNYFGDILIQISFACCKLWMPAFIMYLDIAFMLHRSYKDNASCKGKYGKAWEKYCQKAKYVVIPFVF